MPSTSAKQHRFMGAVANNAAFAKKAGVPQSVGKDFSAADKGRTFSKGGATMMKKSGKEAMMAMAARSAMRRPPMDMGSQAGMPGMKKGGMPMKDGQPAFMKKMNMGGMAGYAKGGGVKMAKGGSASSRADGVVSKGKTKGKYI